MERKDLKFYEAPDMEVVEVSLNASILAGSPQEEDTGADNAGAEGL